MLIDSYEHHKFPATMSELINAIESAYQDPENERLSNDAHRLFLNNIFVLPTRKINKDEEPTALFYSDNGKHFMPVFTNNELFNQWAGEHLSEMGWITIAGKDLVLGCGADVYLCLDVGQSHYKEFPPDEINQLKQVVLKLERIIKASSKT